ncbi:MAG TPA: nucleoside recognition domain-containing protein [Bacteroidales bacterium]|nr:nucleoside recognition domain-containing protein [Bacteroidales bacterium]
MNQTMQRLESAAKSGLPKAKRTILWLLKMILPISLAVRLLQYTGILQYISNLLNPVFQAVGLPGEASIAFVSSVFLPLYAPIAIASSLSLTIRQLTILGIMCLISHNTLVETAIQKKTGSNFAFIWILRISMSFVAAFIWNWVLPMDMGVAREMAVSVVGEQTFGTVLWIWAQGAVALSLKIAVIVTALMVLQHVLEEFHVMDMLSKTFAPIMRFMGLSKNSSFLWFVANIIGLTYGSAIIIEQVQEGKISPKDARLLNNHLAISHSLLEDTSLWVVVGVPLFWVTVPRVALAILVVWSVKGFQKLFRLSE